MTLGLPLGPEVFTIHVAAALAQEPDIEIADQKTRIPAMRHAKRRSQAADGVTFDVSRKTSFGCG